jgi:hypothetical protein
MPSSLALISLPLAIHRTSCSSIVNSQLKANLAFRSCIKGMQLLFNSRTSLPFSPFSVFLQKFISSSFLFSLFSRLVHGSNSSLPLHLLPSVSPHIRTHSLRTEIIKLSLYFFSNPASQLSSLALSSPSFSLNLETQRRKQAQQKTRNLFLSSITWSTPINKIEKSVSPLFLL